MAFTPIRYDAGKLQTMACADAQAIVKGAALVDNTSGYLALATGGNGTQIEFVAMETVTTTATGQKVLCLRVDGVQFEADTDAAPAQTDVGTYVDLATEATLDPDASTDDLFYIEAIKGPVGDKKVIGHFTRGPMNVE